MKKITAKRLSVFFAAAVVCVLAMSVCAFAASEPTGPDFGKITDPIISLIDSIGWYVFGVVIALGSVYSIFLGVKFAKAEEPQDREKAKAHLKNFIIGFFIIFILMLGLALLPDIMKQWVVDNT